MYTPTEKGLEFHQNPTKYFAAVGNRGGGKLLSLLTYIPSPDGPLTMGTVKVGDKVFDERGIPCNVIWKSDPHIDPDGTYKLTFDDGTWVICGANHEWWVFDKHARDQLRRRSAEWREHRRKTRKDKPATQKRRQAIVVEELGRVTVTKEIVDQLVFKTGNYQETNFAIRLTNPVIQALRSFPIDPYVLGAWLGDGSKNCGNITGLDEEVFEHIQAAGYTINRLSELKTRSVLGLRTQLRSIGVWNNKHIPKDYFLGSIEQRLALLQGLMDTDGNCETDGKAEFCNTNIKLAEGVYQLAASLGLKPAWMEGRAKLYGKDCGSKYRVAWTATLPVFRLSRKLARIKTKVRHTQEFRFIVKAERVCDELMQCIQVDSPSHLYLCTNSYIPTHNSIILRFDAHMRCLSCPGCTVVLVRKTYKDLLKNHIYFQGLPWGSLKEEMELLGGTFNKTEYICFYPNGSKMFLTYVGHEDTTNLLGMEILGAYYDELSTIPWDFFLNMSASVRVPATSGWSPVIRAATNPLGESTAEVMSFFVTKDIDYEVFPDYDPAHWGHIKVMTQDNPHQDPNYLNNLKGLNLPTHIAKAWIEGEYYEESTLFSFYPIKNDKPYHVIRELDIPSLIRNARIYRVYDHGYKPDPAYCAWIAHLGNRYIVFHEKVWYETIISDIAEDIKQEDDLLGVNRIVATYCDPSIDVKTGQDIRTMKDLFEDHGIPMDCSINNREQYASAVHTALSETITLSNSEDKEVTVPRLQIYNNGPRIGCPYLVKAIPLQRYNPKRPNAMADQKHDHPVVALAYFLISHSADEKRTLIERTVKPWMRPKRDNRWILGKTNVAPKKARI